MIRRACGKAFPFFWLCVLGMPAHSANAQQLEHVASESRDAAVGLVGSIQFTVGRLGRDCLSLLGRKESAQVFVGSWQQRNRKYVEAAAEYVQARLQEAERTSEETKKAVLQGLAVARAQAEGSVNALYANGGKEEACLRMIPQIDAGAYDIMPRVPMFDELEALVQWAGTSR